MYQEYDQLFVSNVENYVDITAFRILTTFYEIVQFFNSAAAITII